MAAAAKSTEEGRGRGGLLCYSLSTSELIFNVEGVIPGESLPNLARLAGRPRAEGNFRSARAAGTLQGCWGEQTIQPIRGIHGAGSPAKRPLHFAFSSP